MDKLQLQFGEKPTIEVILFLIGVQEFGDVKRKFSKDEKQDLMHIAVCRLLSYFHYYEFEGKDKDGWPIWKASKDLPYLNLQEQSRLIRQGAIYYFKENEFLD